MADGMNIPMGLNKKGSLQMISGSEQTKKIIRLALSDMSNRNPFIRIGTNPDMIFSVETERKKSEFKSYVTNVFSKLEDEERAKLARTDAITFSKTPDKDGNFYATINYIDLESDKPSAVDITFKRT